MRRESLPAHRFDLENPEDFALAKGARAVAIARLLDDSEPLA
jgi:hypothetical protein